MQSSVDLKAVEIESDYGSWFWFIFISLVFYLLWYGILRSLDIAEVSRNWAKYRCSPSVMPFASLYGHDTSANFTYCMQNIFKSQVGGVTGPYASILGTITTTMMGFVKNLNSLRIMLATLLGGISRIFQEFTDRFKLLMSQVQVISLRIQMLMKRVFGTFFAMIYMVISGIQAGSNFTQTSIFGFISMICFAPETLVNIQGKGRIPISEVVLGDVFEKTNDVVTSVYRFMGDGQTMVSLDTIEVSTNHFVQYEGKWIEAKDHPNAIPIQPWAGGATRPLICLDTSTHRFPINNHIFSDWDETNESDKEVMKLAESILNSSKITELTEQIDWLLQNSIDGEIEIQMMDGSLKKMKDIQNGDVVSTGVVSGTGKRNVSEVCMLPSGHYVSPSQLLWKDTKWVRAGYLYPKQKENKQLYTFLVMNSASIESSSGTFFRDMLEVHSSDLEVPTIRSLKSS
jgi:hypothetical protein